MSPLALDLPANSNWQDTCFLGRMLLKHVGRKTSSIENDITKARNHLRQRGRRGVVFGLTEQSSSGGPSGQ